MTNIDDVKAATELILKEENLALHKIGVKEGHEPNEEQRIHVLNKLHEVVQQNLSPRLVEAIKSTQARLRTLPHPIDALAISQIQPVEEERRRMWEGLYGQHVMKAQKLPS